MTGEAHDPVFLTVFSVNGFKKGENMFSLSERINVLLSSQLRRDTVNNNAYKLTNVNEKNVMENVMGKNGA